MLRGKSGTLVVVGLPGAGTDVEWAGVLVAPDAVQFVGGAPPFEGGPAGGLAGVSARLYELFLFAAHRYLELAEEVDERLAETQRRGRTVPLAHVWAMQRETAFLRAHIGRALVALVECEGPLAAAFPGFADAADPLEGELERARSSAQNVQQSLSDLILLRNAEESNRIADAANELSRTSNRIAALANISNIRMLGLTYIALILGLVSAVVLIPNTAATILGMPSAGWVPGIWVDLLLVALAVVPLYLVFSRPWVVRLLRGFREYEARASEGITDLPELPAQSERPRT
ncbi:MAG TPA: hypothetical protein VFF67_03545 [Thermoplasmata archaeon]|nr:hypothetical protein [Thermoplasmata archaeon]